MCSTTACALLPANRAWGSSARRCASTGTASSPICSGRTNASPSINASACAAFVSASEPRGPAPIVIEAASRVFVSQLEAIGVAFSLPPHLVALVLSPVATELPETINALIWVRQGQERLALANISGAMMIQATIPSSLALFATPWLFDTPLIVAGVLTAIAIVYLWWLFRRGNVDARWLLPVGMLYGVFGAFAIWHFFR